MLPIAKCVANAEVNRTDNKLRRNQSDFGIQHESLIILSHFSWKIFNN